MTGDTVDCYNCCFSSPPPWLGSKAPDRAGCGAGEGDRPGCAGGTAAARRAGTKTDEDVVLGAVGGAVGSGGDEGFEKDQRPSRLQD